MGTIVMNHFRLVDWNVRLNNSSKLMPDFLSSIRPDLCTFQEVTTRIFKSLEEALPKHTGVFSLEERPPEALEGLKRQLGCAIFFTSDFDLHDKYLLDVPFPERTMVAKMNCADGDFTLASIHAPPGASHGKLKPETFVRITKWLNLQDGPIIFGIDANTPKFDRWHHGLNEWWWKDEPILFGEKPNHHLRDLYRVYLDQHPEISAQARNERPDGPLAVTYFRGNRKDSRTPCRYDLIYGTEHFTPKKFTFPFEASVDAGSDHSAVVADLRFLS